MIAAPARPKERRMDERKDERDEKISRETERDENRDPLTDTPGAHPFGVAGGGAGGAAAGAAIGAAVGGPVGAVVGGAVGAVAGGAAGKGVAEMVNPTEEEEYWKTEYRNRPYYRAEREWEFYQPAYRYGWESAGRPEYRGRTFEEIEPELSERWNLQRRSDAPHPSEWTDVRDVSRDAYERVHSRSSRPHPDEEPESGRR
jgi:hypothetical protein